MARNLLSKLRMATNVSTFGMPGSVFNLKTSPLAVASLKSSLETPQAVEVFKIQGLC